jgi:hypothetical protein
MLIFIISYLNTFYTKQVRRFLLRHMNIPEIDIPHAYQGFQLVHQFTIIYKTSLKIYFDSIT